jgi:DNA-binding response OmpR family regulator
VPFLFLATLSEEETMRVLLVEDEKKVAAFIRKGLTEEGYAVVVAHDGPAALAQAWAAEPEVMILDVMLPGLDGVEVARRLRAQGCAVPILMLTARDALRDKVQGLDAGADDYLTKPFAFEELLARLRALLRRSQGAATATTLRVADLCLDPATRRVTRGGQVIDLTAREYALLEYLLRHAGRVLNRATLLQQVWDYDFDPESNVVEVYINYLRRKVDEGFEPKLIHTVRGMGYVLRESP